MNDSLIGEESQHVDDFCSRIWQRFGDFVERPLFKRQHVFDIIGKLFFGRAFFFVFFAEVASSALVGFLAEICHYSLFSASIGIERIIQHGIDSVFQAPFSVFVGFTGNFQMPWFYAG